MPPDDKATVVLAPPFRLYVIIPSAVPFRVKVIFPPEHIEVPEPGEVILAVVKPLQVLAETDKSPVPAPGKNNALLFVAAEAIPPHVPLYAPRVVFTVKVPVLEFVEPRSAVTLVLILRFVVTFTPLVNVFNPVPSKNKLFTVEGKPLPVL